MRDAASLLRRARLASGMSQAALARAAGVSQPQISAYENGRREPTVPTLRRLVEAAGHELRLGLRPADAGPLTLRDLAERIAGEPAQARARRWLWVREFLRGFHDDAQGREARYALIAETPAAIGEPRWDALLGALAEHLSFHHDLPCPRWAGRRDRFLDSAWFLSDRPAMRADAFETSPASFRRRNIFIDRGELRVA